jgi:hypothetical protein
MTADIDGVKRISEILKFRGTRCQGSQVRIRLSAEGNPVRTLGSTDRSSGSTHIRPIIVPRPRRCSTAALADGFVPLESDRRHCRIRLHRSRTLVISVPFPKETRIHKWDHEFESAFLQRRVMQTAMILTTSNAAAQRSPVRHFPLRWLTMPRMGEDAP